MNTIQQVKDCMGKKDFHKASELMQMLVSQCNNKSLLVELAEKGLPDLLAFTKTNQGIIIIRAVVLLLNISTIRM